MFGQRRLALMAGAQIDALLAFQHLHGLLRRGGERRRKRGREDERGRVGAHGVDDRGIRRDIAAQSAKALGERALDYVDAVHLAVAIGDAAAARAIKADGVNLVEIGHGVVARGEIGDLADRRDVAVHRIKALEGD